MDILIVRADVIIQIKPTLIKTDSNTDTVILKAIEE